jgi:hypothetical protein
MRLARLTTLLVMAVMMFSHLIGQSNTLRSSEASNYQRSPVRVTTGLNFRIEDGKFWINGNLIPSKDLPKSLQGIDKAIFYQAAVNGMDELGFSLGGNDYTVRENKISEVAPPVQRQLNIQPELTSNTTTNRAAEDYYSQIKREAPGLFYSLNYEGALYEQARGLVADYQVAKGKKRDQIREELRVVLSQLFDINEHNRELEIKELQQMIESAKEEVQYRKANKAAILDNTLDQVLR